MIGAIMINYTFFKQYISPDKTPTKIHQSKYYFSSLTASEVTQAEHELGICFPPQLIKFYLEVGYGYIGLDNPYFRNQIMRPKEIVKLRLGQDFYGNMSTDDLEYYSSNDVLPFFDLGGESDYLVIKLTGENKGSIIYFGDIIALLIKLFHCNNNHTCCIHLIACHTDSSERTTTVEATRWGQALSISPYSCNARSSKHPVSEIVRIAIKRSVMR